MFTTVNPSSIGLRIHQDGFVEVFHQWKIQHDFWKFSGTPKCDQKALLLWGEIKSLALHGTHSNTFYWPSFEKGVRNAGVGSLDISTYFYEFLVQRDWKGQWISGMFCLCWLHMQQAHCCISLPEKGEPRRQGTDLWMIWKSGDILVLSGTDMVEPQEIRRSKYPPTRNYIKNSDLNCPLVSDSSYHLISSWSHGTFPLLSVPQCFFRGLRLGGRLAGSRRQGLPVDDMQMCRWHDRSDPRPSSLDQLPHGRWPDACNGSKSRWSCGGVIWTLEASKGMLQTGKWEDENKPRDFEVLHFEATFSINGELVPFFFLQPQIATALQPVAK